uniref:Uncharacterized protein n=2 Tax=Anguilla anguilla TaxID=7936 RepID=A0A0E9VBP2_ANGAN
MRYILKCRLLHNTAFGFSVFISSANHELFLRCHVMTDRKLIISVWNNPLCQYILRDTFINSLHKNA